MALRYANVAGGGDGTSTGSTWTLTQAFSSASAGDTVYVQAGAYGGQISNVEYNITVSGTQSNPIQFIGCDASWTPIVNNNFYSYYSKEDVIAGIDTTDMPYIEGFMYASWDKATNVSSGVGTSGDFVGAGTGIKISAQYVTVENFIVKGYNTGVLALYPNNTIRNVLAMFQGDFDLESSYDKCYVDGGGVNGVPPSPECDGIGAFDNYSGTCINAYGANTTVEHCLAWNGGAEGIRLRGNNNTHRNNYIGSDSYVNATDYYYQISYQTGALIEDCYIYRAFTNRHGGHGIALRHQNTNSIIRRVTVEGTNYELQNIATNNNLIEDCFSIDSYVSLSNGANNNLIKNMSFTGANSRGILFANWSDGDDLSGYDNDIVGCKFLGGIAAIDFNSFSTNFTANGASNNSFINCTFDSLDALIIQERVNTNTLFENCSFSNITNFVVKSGNPVPCYLVDIDFNFCNWYGNGFTAPTTGTYNYNSCGNSTITVTNSTTGNPLFNGSFVPQAGSALIDAGVVNAKYTTDFQGNTVPFGALPDIGAEESQGGVGDTTPPSITSLVASNITETTFRVSWNLDEGSKGSISYGTATGVYTITTTLESNFLSFHAQTVGGNNTTVFLSPNTTYYYVINMEDASGNTSTSIEYTTTTLSDGETPPTPSVIEDSRKLYLKM